MTVQLRLTEEISSDGRMWYSVYGANRYVGGSYDRETADKMMVDIESLLKAGKKLDPVTIYSVNVEIK